VFKYPTNRAGAGTEEGLGIFGNSARPRASSHVRAPIRPTDATGRRIPRALGPRWSLVSGRQVAPKRTSGDWLPSKSRPTHDLKTRSVWFTLPLPSPGIPQRRISNWDLHQREFELRSALRRSTSGLDSAITHFTDAGDMRSALAASPILAAISRATAACTRTASVMSPAIAEIRATVSSANYGDRFFRGSLLTTEK
jgi:hypothetical protein